MHLVAHLNALEGRPWHQCSRGSPMSQNQLANLLRPFKIKSATIRFDDAVQGSMTAKGYMRDDFAEAWNRYLSQTDPSQSVTSSQDTAAAVQQFSIRHKQFGCYGSESPESHGHSHL